MSRTTPIALAALLLASTTPHAAEALAGYTVYAGNDQCPTNNSVSQVTGKPWTLGPTIAVGHCPAGIAFMPDGSRAYVLNAGENTITPIDTASFAAGPAFPAGVSAPIFVAVTPDGQSIVTAGAASNELAVIATADTASIKKVVVGSSPQGVAVLPDGSAVYVANQGSGTVSVVKLGKTPKLVKTISFPPPGCTPYGIAAAPDGQTVYAACTNGPLWPIKVAKNKAAAEPIAIPQSGGTVQVVVTPNGQSAYVSNTFGAVYPVTLKTGAVGAPIAIPGAYGLAVSPDGKFLMVGDGDCCWVDTPLTVVQTSTNSVVSVIPTGTNYVHRWLAFKP